MWEFPALVLLAVGMTVWSLFDYQLWPAAAAVWTCVAYATWTVVQS